MGVPRRGRLDLFCSLAARAVGCDLQVEKGDVPVITLKKEGFELQTSNAIARYLVSTHPGPLRSTDGKHLIDEWIERARARVLDVEAPLSSQNYLVGDTLSLADLA